MIIEELYINYRNFSYRNFNYRNFKNLWHVDLPLLHHARAVLRRMHQLQLGHIAASLSFTSMLALIPTFAVLFAIFTAFPAFETLRSSLEAYLVKNLMPPAIARQILDYLTVFAIKAKKISAFGGVTVLIAVIMMLATIERVFDRIWSVARQRPLSRRLVIYWTLITLGPILLALLFISGDFIADTLGFANTNAANKSVWVSSITSITLLAGFFSALYFLVPNRFVLVHHALIGGLFSAILVELMRRIFSYYVTQSSSYTMIYGALAAIPILLIWLDIFWLVVLFGAIVTAYLPERKYLAKSQKDEHHLFFDATDLLTELAHARAHAPSALVRQEHLISLTQLSPHRVEFILKKLAAKKWVSLHVSVEKKNRFQSRNVRSWSLLINPQTLRLSELYQATAPVMQSHVLADNLSQQIAHALSFTLADWAQQKYQSRVIHQS